MRAAPAPAPAVARGAGSRAPGGAPLVEVAAAVIERGDGAFLLARRPPGKVYAGWWEFPGGKIDMGERARDAIDRELHEELGIEVRRSYPWITRVHAYEHASVRLSFFRVVEWAGEPSPREQQDLRWQRLDEPMAEPMLPANALVLAALALPHEYAITSAESLGIDSMLARLECRLKAGLKLVQLREKAMAPDALTEFAAHAAQLAHRHGARLLVNADSAPLSHADGVHYPAARLMRLRARPATGLAAASCHTRAELDRAMQLEMDFAVLGPVLPTSSHPGAAALGWEGFADLARGSSIPVYAVGGMRASELPIARSAGAHGLAMIGGAWNDPAAG